MCVIMNEPKAFTLLSSIDIDSIISGFDNIHEWFEEISLINYFALYPKQHLIIFLFAGWRSTGVLKFGVFLPLST